MKGKKKVKKNNLGKKITSKVKNKMKQWSKNKIMFTRGDRNGRNDKLRNTQDFGLKM